MPAILPYFWNIFSTSVFTTWKVFRLPTNTLQTRTIEKLPHCLSPYLLFTAWGVLAACLITNFIHRHIELNLNGSRYCSINYMQHGHNCSTPEKPLKNNGFALH